MPTEPIDSALGRLNIHDATGMGDARPDRVWAATKRAIAAAGFELVGRLPSGMSSDVWSARKTVNGRRLGTRLVVKVIVDPRNPDAVRFFQHEVKHLNSERLPTDVVPILHYHQETDRPDNPTTQPFIVMEEIVGATILEHGATLKGLDARLLLVARCFSALQRVHEHRILHGDISHNNLFVEAAGRVRVIDFGGSKAVDQVGSQSATIHVGTMHCAPLSYLLGKAKLEPWVDIHALGSVAYHVLVGKWPDKTPKGAARNRDHLLDAKVPEKVVRIILKCLHEKNPNVPVDRDLYATAEQVATEIRTHLKRTIRFSGPRSGSAATVG